MQEVVEQAPRSEWTEGRQAMQTPEDVQAMLKLKSLGWGAKRISRELGCSRNTVRSYLRQGGWLTLPRFDVHQAKNLSVNSKLSVRAAANAASGQMDDSQTD